MKSSAFADRLEEVAEMFASAQATSASAALGMLVPIFRVLPAKSVTDVTKKLTEHDFPSASFMQARLETIARLLPAVERFAAAIASKTVAADFTAFAMLLEKNKSAGLDQFVAKATEILANPVAGKPKTAKAPKSLRTDLVEQYNKRLEEALGDDPGFRQEIAQLQLDAEMASGEMAALAKRFAFVSAKGREQALKKIMSRHQDLMIARAASRATAGRIAG